MYLHFFGLTEKPFHSTPDPRFLYTSPSHREALAALLYGVEQRQGFATIIGEVGVGKTTILRAFLEHVDGELDQTIYIYNPNLTFKALLQQVLHELGQELNSHDVDGMIRQLQDVLIAQYRKQGTIVLLIDEAQNMPVATLENLRMLSNIETTTDKLLQIVLIGQPELDTLLNENALRQLRQRITLRAVIRPLTKEESFAYIQHRLAKSGGKLSSIFLPKAVNIIIRAAEGIPRRLNILCDNSLLTGFGYGQKPITPKIVKEVVADIDGQHKGRIKKWLPLSVAALLALITIPWLYETQGTFPAQLSKEPKVSALRLDAPSKELPPNPMAIATSTIQGNQVSATSSPLASVTDLSLPTTQPASPTTMSPSSSMRANVELKQEKHQDHEDTLHKIIIDKDGLKPEHTQPLSRTHDYRLTSNKGTTAPSSPNQIKAQTTLSHNTSRPVSIHAQSMSQRSKEIMISRDVETSGHRPNMKIYTIQSGDTLDSLIRTVYGRSSPSRIQRVLHHNPHIKSPSRLYPGQELIFPTERHE